MKNVNEVSRISGVSVRTLHYYDEIDLLKPTSRTDAGYRLYDDTAIEKLKSILVYKELEFPLEKIKEILNKGGFTKDIIKEQINLLKTKRKHFDDLIALANNMLKEESTMDFSAFSKEKLKEYDNEAKKRWGTTKEYAEYETKKTDNDYSIEFMRKFAYLGKLKDKTIEDEKVKNTIYEIKDFISKNYYSCSDEMFVSLGNMYALDERFKNNIDSVGGEGTAKFANEVIKHYFNK